MKKILENILLIISLIFLISACNTTPEKKLLNESESENINQQVFLIGNGPNSKKTINDMIEKSGIRKGGYVVIIPTSFKKNNPNARHLKRDFNEQHIMAVHILDLHPDSALKNTDILAIENASILCLLGGNRNKFIKLAIKTRIKSALLQAYKNGTLIAGIGKGASVLGDYYFNQVRDSISQGVKLIEKPGLGLLKNTVIEDITFFGNYKEGIQKNSIKKNFVFIGLGYKSTVWIKNEEALVLRKSEIGLISPDKAITKLSKGDEFKLILQ